MLSQILHSLDTMITIYSNAHRKKGHAPIKVPPQFQPDYVELAKKNSKKKKREESLVDQADLAEIFEKRNNQVNKLEVKKDGP